jgi:hypothetical protein
MEKNILKNLSISIYVNSVTKIHIEIGFVVVNDIKKRWLFGILNDGNGLLELFKRNSILFGLIKCKWIMVVFFD